MMLRRNMLENMGDHPIVSNDWKVHEITGVVDADAEYIWLGVLIADGAIAWLDDVRFEAEQGEGKK